MREKQAHLSIDIPPVYFRKNLVEAINSTSNGRYESVEIETDKYVYDSIEEFLEKYEFNSKEVRFSFKVQNNPYSTLVVRLGSPNGNNIHSFHLSDSAFVLAERLKNVLLQNAVVPLWTTSGLFLFLFPLPYVYLGISLTNLFGYDPQRSIFQILFYGVGIFFFIYLQRLRIFPLVNKKEQSSSVEWQKHIVSIVASVVSACISAFITWQLKK